MNLVIFIRSQKITIAVYPERFQNIERHTISPSLIDIKKPHS